MLTGRRNYAVRYGGFVGDPKGELESDVVLSHGVMVLAWARDSSGKSLLYDRKTTTLPEHLEKLAYVITAPVLGDYYRTYPGKYTARLVQEVCHSSCTTESVLIALTTVSQGA